MFASLGRFTHRRSWRIVIAAVLLAVGAALWGPGVSEAVKAGGFDAPNADSARAEAALTDAFGRTSADVLVIYRNSELTADDPAFAAGLESLLTALPADSVVRVVHPWSLGVTGELHNALLGTDGRSALVALTLAGSDVNARTQVFTAVRGALSAPPPWQVQIGGPLAVGAEMTHDAESDIAAAESVAMPVLLALLVLIFGSLVAAALPVAMGALAILGAMALLRLLTLATDLSTFALNVTTILGLGLAIDYSLFVVSRFREELRRTDDVEAAISTTVATAGRTVAYSGLTVLIAFAGMLLFPQMFLRSMGLGGMAVVVLDMLLAITLLPALLSLLGHRVDAGRLPRGLTARLAGRRRAVGEPGAGWLRFARAVLRRPGLVALVTTAVLGIVALPALGLHAGFTDVRDLPVTADARRTTEAVEAQFPRGGGQVTLDVVLTGQPDPASLNAYLTTLTALPAVTGAHVVAANEKATQLAVTTSGAADATATFELVRELRNVPSPAGHGALVGGEAAVNTDSITAITDTLPWTLLVVGGATMVLLFLALGSVVLPVKAVVMNALSLGATAGFLWWGFGEGHLADALGFTAAGRIAPSNLVLIGVLAFGLAMDYELFLLSRVREAHLAGHPPAEAIAVGLQRSGRTITSAALLLVVVLVAMGASGITFLKVIGLGLAFAVVLDAVVVRSLLVPALVALLGRSVWWLPRPLARLHARIALSDGDAPARPRSGMAATEMSTPALERAGARLD
jgi:RND superfamily putative drug exporter